LKTLADSQKADSRMKQSDLMHMPIEQMLGSRVSTMPCDVWRAGKVVVEE